MKACLAGRIPCQARIYVSTTAHSHVTRTGLKALRDHDMLHDRTTTAQLELDAHVHVSIVLLIKRPGERFASRELSYTESVSIVVEPDVEVFPRRPA